MSGCVSVCVCVSRELHEQRDVTVQQQPTRLRLSGRMRVNTHTHTHRHRERERERERERLTDRQTCSRIAVKSDELLLNGTTYEQLYVTTRTVVVPRMFRPRPDNGFSVARQCQRNF